MFPITINTMESLTLPSLLNINTLALMRNIIQQKHKYSHLFLFKSANPVDPDWLSQEVCLRVYLPSSLKSIELFKYKALKKIVSTFN